MLLTSYRYREFWEQSEHWEVEAFSLGQINLLVGKNSSGKTRIVNTINSLALFLRGQSVKTWNSGQWEIVLTDNTTIYSIHVTIKLGRVFSEKLEVNGEVRLERDETGAGFIWYEQLGENVAFQLDGSNVAVVSRRDKLQHPFLEPLHKWGANVRMYLFSTDLGRGTIAIHTNGSNPENAEAAAVAQAVVDQNAVVEQYNVGYETFGDPFDSTILEDLRAIGYPCSSIDTVPMPGAPIINNGVPVMLQVQEEDLKGPTSQLVMSTGMFRALSIIIHMNFSLLADAQMTLIIDDIGEGLDYSRSQKLIALMVQKCKSSAIQLLLTSNDRFVMNEIDLAYWHILKREGHIVTVVDASQRPAEIENFRYMGLSNFDFFTMGAFDKVVH